MDVTTSKCGTSSLSAALITNMYPRLISSQLPNALMKIWSPAHCSSGECGLNAENMVHCCVYMTDEVFSSSDKVITINEIIIILRRRWVKKKLHEEECKG